MQQAKPDRTGLWIWRMFVFIDCYSTKPHPARIVAKWLVGELGRRTIPGRGRQAAIVDTSMSEFGFWYAGLSCDALHYSDLYHGVTTVVRNSNDQYSTRLVKLPVRSRGSHEYKTVCFERFDNLCVGLRFHANTGSIMSLLASRVRRPFIAMSHAAANQPLTASWIIARTSSSVSPCVTHPGSDGTSAQYPVSGALHL